METYRLLATPLLFPEGEFEGKLKSITFTAISPSNTKQWCTLNCGQFGGFFSKLVPSKLAGEMLASLKRGDNIDFPGVYQGSQFDGGFAYVHDGNPVVLR
jgi:hypothetical protein